MNQPVHDIKYTGSLRTKASGSSGPADEFSSRSVIDPHGVITQTSNYGVPVSKVLGDGRTWTPILGSIPSTPVAGTYYIRNIAGIDTFVFVDSSNVEHPLSSTGMSPGAPVVIPLSNIYPTPNVLITQLVDSTDVIEASIAIVNNSLGTRSFHRVLVSHNGTASSDATVGQVSSSGGIAFGNQQVTFDVIFTGSGATQDIQLVAYTTLTGLTAYVTRPFIVTGASGGLTPALSAISALSPSADTFPYYTGPTTASLATITSYGRSVVGTANNNALLSLLGLSNTIGRVPFSGASGLLDDSTLTFDVANKILGIDVLKFNASVAAPSHVEGRVYWDSTDHTLAIMSDISGTVLQVGQENWVRITNMNGAINNGQCVYINGAQGQRPTATLARSDSDATCKSVIGLATNDIAAGPNTDGFITTEGLVRGLNTTSGGLAHGETWVVGDRLFLSATVAGELTKVMPLAPNNTVSVGIVIQVHPTQGSIFVNPDIGWHLGELSDVYINAVANNNILQYVSASSRWENVVPSASLVGLGGLATTAITGTLTLTKPGTTARQAAFPDANIIVAGSAAALTSGRIPFAAAGGLLTDDNDFTITTLGVLTLSADASGPSNPAVRADRNLYLDYDFGNTGGTFNIRSSAAGSTPLSIATGVNGTITLARPVAITGLTNGRIPQVGAGGLLADAAWMKYDIGTFFSQGMILGDGTANAGLTICGLGPANSSVGMQFCRGGAVAANRRWFVGTNTAESGSDTGGLFFISAYNDSGALIDTAFQITRAAGGGVSITRPTTIAFNSAVMTVGNGVGTPVLNINGAAASQRVLGFQTAGVNRAWLYLTNTAESGSNAGSNLAIGMYTDAGAFIDAPIEFGRAAGTQITVRRQLTLDYSGAVLTVGNGGSAGTPVIALSAQAASPADMRFTTNGSRRWVISKNNGAESGSNAGSGFDINAYSDSNVFIDTPVSIPRAAGSAIAFNRPINVTTINSSSQLIVTSAATTGAVTFWSATTSAGDALTFGYTETAVGSIPADIWRFRLGGNSPRAFAITAYDTTTILNLNTAGNLTTVSMASGRTVLTGAASTSTPLLSIIPNSGAATDYALAVWGDAPEGTSRRFSISRGGNAYVDTDLVIGADPGGAQKLRVGGSLKLGNAAYESIDWGTSGVSIYRESSLDALGIRTGASGNYKYTTISSAGNLGVPGTTTTAGLISAGNLTSIATLSGTASLYLTGIATDQPAIRFAGGTSYDLVMYRPSNLSDLVVSRSNGAAETELFRIKESGAVTIAGTVDATRGTFVVTGGSTTNPIISRNNQAAAAGVGSYIQFQGIGTASQGAVLTAWDGAATTSAYLSLWTASSSTLSERARITSGGSLLLGSTTDGLTSGGSLRVSKDLVSAGQRVVGLRSVTSANGTTALDSTDHAVVVTGSANQTITLPAAATGRWIIVKSRSTGTITVQRAGSDTIDGSASSIVLSTNQSYMFLANSTDWALV